MQGWAWNWNCLRSTEQGVQGVIKEISENHRVIKKLRLAIKQRLKQKFIKFIKLRILIMK